MRKKSRRGPGPKSALTVAAQTLQFTGSLAQFGRRAFSVDHEGEAVLALAIPLSDVPAVSAALEVLIGNSFEVTIKL